MVAHATIEGRPLEIRTLFTELLGRIDHIELAGGPLMHSTLVSGPKNLPVRLTMHR